jgi:ubiquinone/menaquinone biosynthesis C-methylase UbiE
MRRLLKKKKILMHTLFYSSIGRYYDDIFPYNPAKKEFTRSFLENPNSSSILDIGCGTGDLAMDLAEDGNAVYAIDADQEMIKQAIRKKMPSALDQYPVFRDLDMKRISRFFCDKKFDCITCYGNTLVHLQNTHEVADFLNASHNVLNTNGILLIQILNYEYVLRENIRELPALENEKVRFDRFYEDTESGHVDFVTYLTIKQDQSALKNRIKLYPLKKEQLTTLLEQSGFGNIKFYGDFEKIPFNQDALPLLVKAEKQ